MSSFDALMNIPKEQLEFLLAEVEIAIEDNQKRYLSLIHEIKPLVEQAHKLKEDLAILKEKRNNYETFLSVERGTLVSMTDSIAESIATSISDSSKPTVSKKVIASKLKKPTMTKIFKPSPK